VGVCGKFKCTGGVLHLKKGRTGIAGEEGFYIRNPRGGRRGGGVDLESADANEREI